MVAQHLIYKIRYRNVLESPDVKLASKPVYSGFVK
jgi:hypothetical protein